MSDNTRPSVTALATAVAQREWDRLTGLPAAARTALVTDTVWNREYEPIYHDAYTTAASQIAATATEAATRNPGAWLTLHHLASAAGEAVGHKTPEHPPVPPADQPTVAAARTALVEPGREPPWQRIASVAAAGSRTAATLAGTLTAATDALIGWRSRYGHVMAEGITVDGRPALTWVRELLTRVNREAARRIAAIPARTAAQLAGEDTAAGVASQTVAASGGRTRPDSPAPAARQARRTR